MRFFHARDRQFQFVITSGSCETQGHNVNIIIWDLFLVGGGEGTLFVITATEAIQPTLSIYY